MPVFDALVRAAEPKDMATLIYTSGTTGEPKGVVLTHGNIAANINYAPEDFNFDSSDALISFLPLSHVTARALDYFMYSFGVQVAYCSQFDKLPAGDARDQANGFCGCAAGIREDSPGGGAPRGVFAGEEAPVCLGDRGGSEAYRYGL